MSDTINIKKEEYERLRKCLIEAMNLLHSMGLGESIIQAPQLTPKEIRKNKYRRLLDERLNKKYTQL